MLVSRIKSQTDFKNIFGEVILKELLSNDETNINTNTKGCERLSDEELETEDIKSDLNKPREYENVTLVR